MFSSALRKFPSLLAEWLFLALFLGAAFQYRSGRLAELGTGFVYLCVSAYLAILSFAPRFGKSLLIAAYLTFLIGLLNYFSTARGAQALGNHQNTLALVISVLYGLLAMVLVWLPMPLKGLTFPLPQSIRPLVYRLTVSTSVAFGIALGVCVAAIMSAHVTKVEGGRPFMDWNPLQYSMLFIALFSGVLGTVLFWSAGSSGLRLACNLKAIGLLVAVLLSTGLVEYAFRQNWPLCILSSVAFGGLFLGYCQVCSRVSRMG